MPWFAYSVFDSSPKSLSTDEVTGVIEARSMEEAAFWLLRKGYVIREIRNATERDLQIEKFRKLRQRLTKGRAEPLKDATWVEATPRRSFPWTLLFVLMVILLIVAYLSRGP